uniref:SH2 domain-containing protein n=1 Tax=Macrostomum lignano TaxID=282301 RepID=A0A1I8FRR7_9PLAT
QQPELQCSLPSAVREHFGSGTAAPSETASAAARSTVQRRTTFRLVADSDKLERLQGTAAERKLKESCIPDVNRSIQVHPGKRGGRYQLPDGGCLTIPEAGGFSPQRQHHPRQRPSVPQSKMPAGVESWPLKLPEGEPSQFSDCGCCTEAAAAERPWKELPASNLEADYSSIRVDTRSLGTYMMLLSSSEETFQISPNGGLIDFRIDQCDVAADKGAAARSPALRRSETMDIAALTPMYSFRCERRSRPRPKTDDADSRKSDDATVGRFRRGRPVDGLLDLKRASPKADDRNLPLASSRNSWRPVLLRVDASFRARLPRPPWLGSCTWRHPEGTGALNTGRPGPAESLFDRRREPDQSTVKTFFDGSCCRPALQPTGARVDRAVRAGTPERGLKLPQQPRQVEAAKSEQLLLRRGDSFSVELTGDFQLQQTPDSQAGTRVKLPVSPEIRRQSVVCSSWCQTDRTYLDLKPPPPPASAAALDSENADEAAGSAGNRQDDAAETRRWFHYPQDSLKLRIYELDPQQARLESQQRLLAPKRNAQPAHGREPRALSRRRPADCLAEGQIQQGPKLGGIPESAVSALGFRDHLDPAALVVQQQQFYISSSAVLEANLCRSESEGAW